MKEYTKIQANSESNSGGKYLVSISNFFQTLIC